MAQKNLKLALLVDLDSVNGIDNETDNDKKSGTGDFINYLENRYGHLVYRVAYADWNNNRFRKTAQDFQRNGIEMKHLVHTGKGKNGAGNCVFASILFDLSALLCSRIEIEGVILVSNDTTMGTMLPLLKNRGLRSIGIARDNVPGNYAKQFDDFLYLTERGFSTHARKNSDKCQVMSFLKQHIGPEGVRLNALEEIFAEELPEFSPADYDCNDLAEYLGATNQVKLTEDNDGILVSWQPNVRNASAYTNEELQNFSFAEYMQATRWFILDGSIRDRVLHNIYTIFEDGTRILTNDELRNLVDPDHIIEDRPWHGTIYSLVYGACLWENPDSADYKLPRKRLSLFRTVKSEEDFLIRYYTSLFHKAYVERPELTARMCAELMHPDDVEGHVELYEQVLEILKEKK